MALRGLDLIVVRKDIQPNLSCSFTAVNSFVNLLWSTDFLQVLNQTYTWLHNLEQLLSKGFI